MPPRLTSRRPVPTWIERRSILGQIAAHRLQRRRRDQNLVR
jgi:hypothetical protein